MNVRVKAPAPTQPETQQLVQVGILVATLGVVLSFIGLYPGVTGLEPKSGIGVLQILILLSGMPLMVSGGMLFVKIGFYPQTPTNLTQRIAVRLSITGLMFSVAVGMSDILGYGSNPPEETSFPILGTFQRLGMIAGFGFAVFGVFLFWLGGPSRTKRSWTLSDAKRTTSPAVVVTADMLKNYEVTLASKIRPVQPDEAEAFLNLLQRLDRETAYMLLEPDERQTTIAEQREKLDQIASDDRQTILVADYEDKLVGFVAVSAGEARRNRHCGYLVIGILQAYTNQGLGTRLFENVEAWAKAHDLTRLELTVMAHNESALALYRKMGFQDEGRRKNALKVRGDYVDEIYMGKILKEKS